MWTNKTLVTSYGYIQGNHHWHEPVFYSPHEVQAKQGCHMYRSGVPKQKKTQMTRLPVTSLEISRRLPSDFQWWHWNSKASHWKSHEYWHWWFFTLGHARPILIAALQATTALHRFLGMGLLCWDRATKNNVFFFYFAAMFFHMSKLTRFSSPSFFISKLCLILLLPNHIVSFHAYFNRIDQP
jgi:hypothetical protein